MMTFSFRAECAHDIQAFIATCATASIDIQITVAAEGFLPDSEAEFTSSASLETLRNVLRKVPDGHVMLQTLRPCPLAKNPLLRDYDLV